MKNINPEIAQALVTRIEINDQLTGDTFITFVSDVPTTVDAFRQSILRQWVAGNPRADVLVYYYANNELFAGELIDAQ